MTNEELVIMIQNGNKDIIGTLWDNISKFAYKQSLNFYNHCKGLCDSSGITFDDLYQCSFLAMLDGIEKYNNDSNSSFINFYCNYPLKTAFRSAIGIRTVKKYPLNDCTSLDTPLNDYDNLTLIDTVQDSKAEQSYDNVINKEFNEELHTALVSALDVLEPKQKDFIVDKYFNNLPLQALSDKHNISKERVRQVVDKGLHKLRQPGSKQNKLKSFIDYGKSYTMTGLGAWKSYGSVEERLVEKVQLKF